MASPMTPPRRPSRRPRPRRASRTRDGPGPYVPPGRAGAPPGMAILIQRLVPADAAGVAFTANPLTGDRGETLVSSVRGLGERLVSGEATPDDWIVRGRAASWARGTERSIDAGPGG